MYVVATCGVFVVGVKCNVYTKVYEKEMQRKVEALRAQLLF